MTSPGEMAARLVVPGFKVGWDDPEDAVRLAQAGVGGFCVYGGTIPEAADFCRKVRGASRQPLILCADYEDGIASHVAGGTAFPSNMGLGASGDEALAFEKGRVTALEARALGIDWVLAPVLDLATQPLSPIVNVRSFGSDPALVSRMARAYVKGLSAGGALSCVKHFPGHGDTELDSHLDLPLVSASREVLEVRELAPYRALRGDADSVMVGHLAVPALAGDAKTPATLSRAVIAGELRGSLGFEGLVVSDALSMHAVAKRFPEAEAAEAALLAGCDVLLVPEDPRKLVYELMRRADADPAVGSAAAAAHARLEAALKVLAVRSTAPPPDLSVVGCAAHAAASARLAERCLAWHRPMEGSLPSRVAYFEPDDGFPEEVQGAAFLEELKALGVEAVAGPRPPEGLPLVVGLFVSPRAYSGRISHGGEELARLKGVLSRPERTVAVSFGSPWALEEAGGRGAALAAFSSSKDAQRSAARALAGKLAVSGRMPVALGT